MSRIPPVLAMVLLGLQDVLHGEGPVTSPPPKVRSAESVQDRAIAYLTERGHIINRLESGLYVALKPRTENQEVTQDDAAALNQLQDLVEIRVVAFHGIEPEVFERFVVFPKVRVVAIHYGMPAAALKYLSKFPNVERLSFWGDQFVSCDNLPELTKLRVFDHESTEGKLFGKNSIERLVACRNLEEIEILLPVSKDGIRALKALPNLRKLEVNEVKIIGDQSGEHVHRRKR